MAYQLQDDVTGLVTLVMADQILINDGKKESEANAALDVALHSERSLTIVLQ